MPAPGEPPTPTSTETSPVRIPLPPPAAAPDAPPGRKRSALDSILAVIALGFAFLVASAPAHNSDLWLHLATGRDLLARKAAFGVDPFAQGTEGVYWVNTNWLYDVLSYAVFR